MTPYRPATVWADLGPDRVAAPQAILAARTAAKAPPKFHPDPAGDLPWGLTARQAQAMDLLQELGHRSQVAKRMGVTWECVRDHLNTVVLKMEAESIDQALRLWAARETA